MLKKRWIVKEIVRTAESRILAQQLNLSDTLIHLLSMRSVFTFKQAKEFFRASLDNLHDPFLMSGLHIATSRVIDAVANHEPILIYGDYDVDGTCSTALLYMFLKELNADVKYFIPNRLRDGYGISVKSIDHVISLGTSLMISVDCGVTAVEEIQYARDHGLDVIICDHHQPKDTIPNAYAVLDPLLPDCKYPFKYLSGAGVAFKLAQGIADRIGNRDLPLKYLDLTALAGAADIVPLVDENRILVKFGLEQINANPRAGIRALIKSSHLQPGHLTSGQIVFTLAPRINAVGRLRDASTAVELLTTEDETMALSLASDMESDNDERRVIDGETLTGALAKINSNHSLEDERVIIIHEEGWHPGVIGIVASRLVEKYYRPTIMLTTIDGVAKGSARSIANFNIYQALTECEDILLHFGGHQAAAGLSIELHRLEEFRLRFNSIVRSRITENDLFPIIEIDSEISLSEITPKFIRIADQFEPFGPQNPKPVFVARSVMAASPPRIVGNNHLLLVLKQNGCERVFDSIGFDLGGHLKSLREPNIRFDIVFSIEQTHREGRTFPQIRLKDIRLPEQ